MARLRNYELVVVLSPALEEEKVQGTVERIHRMVTERAGTVVKQEPWGIRRLAYPIKQFKEGNYFVTHFQMDASRVRDIEANLRVSEEVLRHLLVQAEA